MPDSECFLGVLSVTFELSSVFANTYTRTYGITSFISQPLPRFSSLMVHAYTSPLLSPLTMQVPSIPLRLVSMQAPLISCSTQPKKLLFFQKATTVIMIVGLTHRTMGHMVKLNECPLSTLNSKKCAKKGQDILLRADSMFLSTYSTPGT